MNLAFATAAVAVGAASAWPASAMVAKFSGSPDTSRRRTALLIALITAALILIVAVRVHQILIASAVGWLVLLGVPLVAIDARVSRLPDALTGPCLAGVSVLLTIAAASTGQWHEEARAAAGAAIVAALFVLLALLRPGSAGLGDAKLGLSTGALAAWAGWGVLLGSMFAAFALAAIYGLALLVSGRASLRSSVPFGPFLLGGCLAIVLLAGR
jgi:leader peptidase (prepilin peptidase) / N-methyltransferase